MNPTKTLDIGYRDLWSALLGSVLPISRTRRNSDLESYWSKGNSICCLSVRSAFDLMLQSLKLPAGSEVLCSAVTIADMAEILKAHQLIPVPIDLDVATLAPLSEALERALGPKTRAVLVVHLFGNRIKLDETCSFAERHGLMLWEDCAQAFLGDDYRGEERADVSFFSFGPIKTATALGGALACVRCPKLLSRMRQLHSHYEVMSRLAFVRRVAKYGAIKVLLEPRAYSVLAAICSRFGTGPSDFLGKYLRGFDRNKKCLVRYRLQPSTPALRLLHRRLQNYQASRVHQRAAIGQLVAEQLPRWVVRPGSAALEPTHWLFPICVPDPSKLSAGLRAIGFDASVAASRLVAIEPAPGYPRPEQASSMIANLLYLPVHEHLSIFEATRLARAIGMLGPDACERPVQAQS